MLNALLNQVKNNRKIICISGSIAEGKTISMSVIAQMLKDLYDCKIYTNFELKESLPLENFKSNEEIKIVCIDEFNSVYQSSKAFINGLLSDENEKVIFIIDTFDFNRLPEDLQNILDITIKVKKTDVNTIKISGVNNHYEHFIDISDNTNLYNAFNLAKLTF